MRLLVTGVTGYIGGRLVPELLDAGHEVRVLARHPERLSDRTWVDRVEVVAGDASDPDVVHEALRGIDVAYYLLHSLNAGDGFEDLERRIARTFAAVAREEGVGRIVYVGALLPDLPIEAMSEHFRSRAEVSQILLTSGVPTIELRAAVIIGSGSVSFEMVRYLTERLPVMVTPRWVRTPTQPIAIRDVLYYLVHAATLPGTINRAFEIGGPDVITYEEMMHGYARAAGLSKRVVVGLPFLSPRLSSNWVGLVTPVPRAVAKPLVDSLTMSSVCHEHDIAELVPDPPEGLVPYERAVELALAMSGPRLTPIWARMSSSPIESTVKVAMLLSSCPRASARCSRRADMSTAVSSCVCSAARAWPGRSSRSRPLAFSVTRVMTRSSSHHTSSVMTRMRTIASRLVAIHASTTWYHGVVAAAVAASVLPGAVGSKGMAPA